METQKIPLTIYSEMTPNPNTMKFVTNKMLLDNGVAEYKSIDETKGSSTVAEKIFQFPFVQSIFFTRNFITITKKEVFEWDDITYELRIFLSELLAETPNPIEKLPKQKEEVASQQLEQPENWSYQPVINSETDQQIVDLLEEYVRPAVENDGGAIHFKSFEDGVVTVMLKGACSGCPSSTATLKGGVEQLLKAHVPNVKEVVAEAH